MLPKYFDKWHSGMKRPNSREREDIKKQLEESIESGRDIEDLKSLIITKKEAISILEKLEIRTDSIFYEFYLTFRSTGEELYELNDILEDYKNPFWQEQYPNIQDRYLRISSIEGEHSYFYDKETDAVYSVDWNQMDDLLSGKLKPQWKSFYDFLEWYYSEDEEE